jgi:hypothetical protein
MTAYLFAPLIQFVLSKILLIETLTPSFQSASIILQPFLHNTSSYRGCPGSDNNLSDTILTAIGTILVLITTFLTQYFQL